MSHELLFKREADGVRGRLRLLRRRRRRVSSQPRLSRQKEVIMLHELLFCEKATVYGAQFSFCGDDVVE